MAHFVEKPTYLLSISVRKHTLHFDEDEWESDWKSFHFEFNIYDRYTAQWEEARMRQLVERRFSICEKDGEKGDFVKLTTFISDNFEKNRFESWAKDFEKDYDVFELIDWEQKVLDSILIGHYVYNILKVKEGKDCKTTNYLLYPIQQWYRYLPEEDERIYQERDLPCNDGDYYWPEQI